MMEECVKALRNLEGCRLNMYICAGGKKTIGYGHVVLKGEPYESITELEAENILIQDILKIQQAVNRLVKVPLKKRQNIALIIFIFNVGAGAFQRSTLRQKINSEEHELVREEMMKWVFAKGKRNQGLVRRREFEANIYEGIRKI